MRSRKLKVPCPFCQKDRWRTVGTGPEETIVEHGVFRVIETEILECIHCSFPLTYYKADFIVPQGVV